MDSVCIFLFVTYNFCMKVVRSGDLISYCAEEGVRILGEGKFLVSDSFPGNERSKYCLTSKVISSLFPQESLLVHGSVF